MGLEKRLSVFFLQIFRENKLLTFPNFYDVATYWFMKMSWYIVDAKNALLTEKSDQKFRHLFNKHHETRIGGKHIRSVFSHTKWCWFDSKKPRNFLNVVLDPFSNHYYHLVGGFNPSEKYWSNQKSSPNRGENKKYVNMWNHHPVMYLMQIQLRMCLGNPSLCMFKTGVKTIFNRTYIILSGNLT